MSTFTIGEFGTGQRLSPSGREIDDRRKFEVVESSSNPAYGRPRTAGHSRLRGIFLPFLPPFAAGAFGAGGMQGGSSGYLLTVDEVLYQNQI
ncbi:unnamed protein product [Adineta ricciae]|uniref:Uncharacterized protein n=1 Tax=Adineta ricciae TaxID=249248 RepID=A0A814ASL8_ADIRI|nr:unnamed protein product [Adineta ricciae]CAF1174279.1 unnamed protein product [Adineta ricciae]